LSTPFQNRLVGTIIVAAAVIIFLPDILDGKKQSHQTDFEAIPQAPAFSGTIEEKAFPEQRITLKSTEKLSDEKAQDEMLTARVTEQVIESKKGTNKAINSDKTLKNNKKADNTVKITTYPKDTLKQATATDKKSAPTKQPKTTVITPEKAIATQAWVIHLGSFRHKKNVAELLSKLKRNGYTVYTKPIKTKQGNLTKVFIGPELIKSTLDKKLIPLKKLTNIQGRIARFYPTK